MRLPPALILIGFLAGPAAAQAGDPALDAQQAALQAQQEAMRQQMLEQERQAFVQEQRAQTDRALSDLAAARSGQPPAAQPLTPPASAAWAARADVVRRLIDEAAARPLRLTPRR